MSRALLSISRDLDRVIDALSCSDTVESRLAHYALRRIAKDLEEHLVEVVEE